MSRDRFVALACRQKRNFCSRCWSRTKFNAMEVSQVFTEQSPRKLARLLYAFRRQSWVMDSARSASPMENMTKRSSRGR